MYILYYVYVVYYIYHTYIYMCVCAQINVALHCISKREDNIVYLYLLKVHRFFMPVCVHVSLFRALRIINKIFSCLTASIYNCHV